MIVTAEVLSTLRGLANRETDVVDSESDELLPLATRSTATTV